MDAPQKTPKSRRRAKARSMQRMVLLLCGGCGRKKRMPIMAHEPPETARVEMNLCDRCDTGGGFEEVHYFDTHGVEITPDRVCEWLDGLAEKQKRGSEPRVPAECVRQGGDMNGHSLVSTDWLVSVRSNQTTRRIGNGVGGVERAEFQKAVNQFNFTEARCPETLCLSTFAESAFGKIGAMKTITLTWITRAGAHCMEPIKPEELHRRIVELWRKRLTATAWWGDKRDEECGWVWKLDGKWVWSCENL